MVISVVSLSLLLFESSHTLPCITPKSGATMTYPASISVRFSLGKILKISVLPSAIDVISELRRLSVLLAMVYMKFSGIPKLKK